MTRIFFLSSLRKDIVNIFPFLTLPLLLIFSLDSNFLIEVLLNFGVLRSGSSVPQRSSIAAQDMEFVKAESQQLLGSTVLREKIQYICHCPMVHPFHFGHLSNILDANSSAEESKLVYLLLRKCSRKCHLKGSYDERAAHRDSAVRMSIAPEQQI